MGQVRDLIGAQGATAARVLGPAEYPGLEEGAIDDQLPAVLEQVEQANLALGTFELVLLLHHHPRHPSTLGGQCVTGAGQLLLFQEELLPCSLPLPFRHDPWGLHSCRHIVSPMASPSRVKSQALAVLVVHHARSSERIEEAIREANDPNRLVKVPPQHGRL